ncbi:MAG: YtxH domain-containing protein [Acidobacteria bacterium]|nr:YtxH domain-containing protein [Acidobacteriota bacterium]
MHEESDFSENLIWFVAGAALGASIALLYAPAPGKTTRRYLGDKTRQGREKLTETGKDVVDRGRELYEKGRKVADEAAELFERGRELMEG